MIEGSGSRRSKNMEIRWIRIRIRIRNIDENTAGFCKRKQICIDVNMDKFSLRPGFHIFSFRTPSFT